MISRSVFNCNEQKGIAVITPNDTESKVFGSALRGYKKEEVDQFLDEIMIDYQKLLNENEKLKKDNASLEEQVAEGKKTERSVLKTLEQAKSLMSDISASAEKRAEAIIREAHSDADRIVADARDSVQALNAQNESLKSRITRFKGRYRDMLRDELSKLEDDEDISLSEEIFGESAREYYTPSENITEEHSAPAENAFSAPDQQVQEADEEPETEEQSLTEQVMSSLNGENYAEVNEKAAEEDSVLNFHTPQPVDDKAKTIVMTPKADEESIDNDETRVFQGPIV